MKFYGPIGYITQHEVSPGIHEDVVVERAYRGDILQNVRSWKEGEEKNDNLVISNRISVIADPYAYQNFSTMRYIYWQGVRWKITKLEIQRPRLILTLGEVYNG
jgi:hypothetical protein